MAKAPVKRCIATNCNRVATGAFVVGDERWPLCRRHLSRAEYFLRRQDDRYAWKVEE